jgi:GTP-binding protein
MGMDQLLQAAFKQLQTLPAEPLLRPAANVAVSEPGPRFVIIPLGSGEWQVKGKEVEKWVAMTDFNNEEAVKKLKDIFNRIGLTEGFKEQQVQNGDTIMVGKEEFIYQED